MKTIEQIPDNYLKTWCETFHKEKKCRQMDEDEARTFMFFCVYEKSIEQDTKYQESVKDFFMINVISKRLPVYHYEMTFAAKCALACVFDDSLGINTMNMTYLEFLTKLHGVKKVDMKFLGEKAFPMGIVTEEFYHRMWDEQKVSASPDNLLDYKHFINKIWEETK